MFFIKIYFFNHLVMADNNEKGKEFFRKGAEAYHAKNYQEVNQIIFKLQALKFFEESTKYYKEESVEVYILSCKKKLKVRNEDGKTPEDTNEAKGTPEQNTECQEILKMKCFYQIMKISRDANEEEVKRSYKKLAIKFHPDKNQSEHAADTFKKVILLCYNKLINLLQISHAFQTLKDPEKRKFYDKYGDEEELRQKYHQQQQHYHEEEEIDPFDLFEMFFSGGNAGFFQRNGRMYRRRREDPTQEQAENMHQQRNVRQGNPKQMVWMQLLPLLVLILFSVLPYLFQSVKNFLLYFILFLTFQKPYYQFFIDEEFYKKMTTSINRVDYFVGDRFLKAYGNKLSEIRNVK